MLWTVLTLVIAGVLANPVDEEKAVAKPEGERDEKCEFQDEEVKNTNCDKFPIFSFECLPNSQI